MIIRYGCIIEHALERGVKEVLPLVRDVQELLIEGIQRRIIKLTNQLVMIKS
jgi:hypothetical protein